YIYTIRYVFYIRACRIHVSLLRWPISSKDHDSDGCLYSTNTRRSNRPPAPERRHCGGRHRARGTARDAYGHLEKDDPRPLNGDTIFEIGSATKVFTAVLLANMAERGEVALRDPVVKYLPPGTKMPERNGRSITPV